MSVKKAVGSPWAPDSNVLERYVVRFWIQMKNILNYSICQ